MVEALKSANNIKKSYFHQLISIARSESVSIILINIYIGMIYGPLRK
jgi:hypothetical protein